MSKFNQKTEGSKITNLANGEAYKQSPKLELVSMLLTSFANDQFYEKAQTSFDRLKELIKANDKKFVAKAAVYARTKFGMRSISHVTASELAKYISGEDWAKYFYKAVIKRPDDMVEIIAYHTANNGKVTNSMKKGLAKAFDMFDTYSISKYKNENKKIKMVDVVNVVHPIPIEKNANALKALINGELKSTETWEAKLSNAGQVAKTDEEKAELKSQAWTELIKSKKIGYFALLKNLRNIIEQAPEVVLDAIASLTNEVFIKSSMVLPFRFMTAYEELAKMTTASSLVREVINGINKATEISLSNVPKFEGTTLVVVDVSGSMTINARTPVIASLFAACLVKANNADLMTFDGDARYVNFNPGDTLATISKSLGFRGGSTNFHSIFKRMDKKYDRIIILSDMQGWVGYDTPVVDFNDYKKRSGADPYVYSFDLTGYGSMQFPQQNVTCLAGFSDKIFDIMVLLEQDKNALINEIENTQF